MSTWPTPPHRPSTSPPDEQRKLHRGLGSEIKRWLIVIAITVPVAAVLLIGGLVVAIYVQARSSEFAAADAIIIMGAAQYNGRPSPVLQSRLDTALDAYERGLAPRVVVTGGNQPGDAFTEAGTQRQYLIDRGVPSEAIVVEEISTSTQESIERVAEIVAPLGINRVLIVSDGFHLFRSKLMARDAGLNPVGGLAAEESPIEPGSMSEFSYILRETAGVIVYKLS